MSPDPEDDLPTQPLSAILLQSDLIHLLRRYKFTEYVWDTQIIFAGEGIQTPITFDRDDRSEPVKTSQIVDVCELLEKHDLIRLSFGSNDGSGFSRRSLLRERVRECFLALRALVDDKSASPARFSLDPAPVPAVNLSDFGITEAQALELRGQLKYFASDWDTPDMDAYNQYEESYAKRAQG